MRSAVVVFPRVRVIAHRKVGGASQGFLRPLAYLREVAKHWVLDTETKGTGAHMVPLEDLLEEADRPSRRLSVVKPRARKAEAPRKRQPARFRVTDALSRQVLADDADARQTLQALAGKRSVADVSVHMREGAAGRWRALTLAERKQLFELRDRLSRT